MITDIFDVGAMPMLERTVQFTHRRHQMITHNIANLSTPHYRPTDLDVDGFQAALSEAADRRRDRGGVYRGELEFRDTREIRFRPGDLELREQRNDRNILFHDRNNRSLERTMQDLAENAMMHNAALELLRNQFQILESAIQERP